MHGQQNIKIWTDVVENSDFASVVNTQMNLGSSKHLGICDVKTATTGLPQGTVRHEGNGC